jgi:hypothetical protein
MDTGGGTGSSTPDERRVRARLCSFDFEGPLVLAGMNQAAHACVNKCRPGGRTAGVCV